MEYTAEKPKKSLTLYIIIIILIIAIIAVYFIFFSQTGLTDLFGSGGDNSLVPENLQKDVTGGIVNLKLDPTSILEDGIYRSLQVYAEPVQIQGVSGRPNPFIPF